MDDERLRRAELVVMLVRDLTRLEIASWGAGASMYSEIRGVFAAAARAAYSYELEYWPETAAEGKVPFDPNIRALLK